MAAADQQLLALTGERETQEAQLREIAARNTEAEDQAADLRTQLQKQVCLRSCDTRRHCDPSLCFPVSTIWRNCALMVCAHPVAH